ncbi:MAG: hypothetical protein AB1744_11610, partial [Candidatus Zixiibacteriota bacterium]
HVVIPTAKRLGISIVAIQPTTEQGLELEKRKKEVDSRLRSDESLLRILEYTDLLAHHESELWQHHMQQGDCIEHVQLNEYHVFSEARDRVEQMLFPQRAQLLDEWNGCFLQKIEDTIERNPGRRLLVIAGLWHKYWLWNRLQRRSDVVVHNLHTFRLASSQDRL